MRRQYKTIKNYLILLMVLVLLSAFMALKNMAIGLLLLTLGIAFPLVFIATLALFSLCFFPTVTASEINAGWLGRSLAITLSLFILVAAFAGPGYLAQKEGKLLLSSLIKNDHNPDTPVKAKSLEIFRQKTNYEGLFMDSEPCGYECRTLLLSGQMDWVRVTMLGRTRKHSVEPANASTFYTLARGKKCRISASEQGKDRSCILMSPDSGKTAELSITFETQNPKNLFENTRTMLTEWQKVRVATAHLHKQDQSTEIFRQTEAELLIARALTIVAARMRGMSSGGTELAKASHRLNRISFKSSLIALGYDLSERPGANPAKTKPRSWKGKITQEMSLELAAVLNLPQKQKFNSEQAKVIINWTRHAIQTKPWTKEMIALLRRIIHEPRLKSYTSTPGIFSRHREVAKQLLPDIFHILERDGIFVRDSIAKQVLLGFLYIDSALLKTYSDRILSLAASSETMRFQLLRVMGRIDIDPSPYLTPLPKNGPDEELIQRLRGACYADKKWAKSLIPHIRNAVKNYLAVPLKSRQLWPRKSRRYAKALLKTLANLGDIAFVESELTTEHHKYGTIFSDRYSRRLNHGEKILESIKFYQKNPQQHNRICRHF